MTPSTTPWWTLAATLAGVATGFLLPTIKDWWIRRDQRKAHWIALGTEVEICREHADVLLSANIMSPLYRLPTVAFEHSLPPLLEQAQLSGPELRAFIEFYEQVRTLNRGLDHAHAAGRDMEDLTAQYGRNLLKAKQLTTGTDTLYARIRPILARHEGPLGIGQAG